MAKKQKIGFWGQKIAENYLIDNGYLIIDQNYRTPYGELDLIIRKNGEIVFVEVKTRTSNSFGYPEISITSKKKSHLIHSAEAYMQAQEEIIDNWRIDVVAIQGKPGENNIKIEWFENVICK